MELEWRAGFVCACVEQALHAQLREGPVGLDARFDDDVAVTLRGALSARNEQEGRDGDAVDFLKRPLLGAGAERAGRVGAGRQVRAWGIDREACAEQLAWLRGQQIDAQVLPLEALKEEAATRTVRGDGRVVGRGCASLFLFLPSPLTGN